MTEDDEMCGIDTFNPWTDEIFFIGSDRMSSHGDAWIGLNSWLHDITPATFNEAFNIIRLRWLAAIHENVFEAMINSSYFFEVLKTIAFHIAWNYYMKFDNRDLTTISFVPSYEFTYRDIDQHGSKDVDDWTVEDVDVVWPNVIEIENYKGNSTFLPEDPSKCKYFNQPGDAAVHSCLRQICSYFPEQTIHSGY